MTHEAWKAQYGKLRGIAERIENIRKERAWRLAESVDIPRDMCCLHNASIDTERRGWCAGHNGTKRLRIARHACRIMDTIFDGYRIVERWDKRIRQA